jgi:hypothetical protein
MLTRFCIYFLRSLQTTTDVNLVTMTDVEVDTTVVTTEAVTTTEAAVVTTGAVPATTGEVAEAVAVTERSAATTLGLGTERSRRRKTSIVLGGTVALEEEGTDREKKRKKFGLPLNKHPTRLCFLARFLTGCDLKMRHGLDFWIKRPRVESRDGTWVRVHRTLFCARCCFGTVYSSLCREYH